jgi:hypothetical protein
MVILPESSARAKTKGPAAAETTTGPDLTPTKQLELAMRPKPMALDTGAKYAIRAKAQGGRHD